MPFVGIGVGIGRQRFAQGGIFAAYAARVAADGGTTEAGACVDAVSGISLNSSLLLVPSGYKSGVVYSQIPTNGDGDLTFTRASDATRVNSDGLIEVVGSGVPRLDYSQGSCPALLLEPQRTNLLLRSEEFNSGIWGKIGGATVTANQATAPDGTFTADLITEGSSTLVYYTTSFSAGTYTQSYFAKKGTGDIFGMYFGGGTGATFNLTLGTIISASNATAKIEDFGNGWYRCIATASPTSSFFAGINYGNSTGLTIYAWGAQLEAGAYATSYIPTTSATVTRLADVCIKTGISSLIGQTEGTLFAEGNAISAGSSILPGDSGYLLAISDNTLNNQISIRLYPFDAKYYIQVRNGGSLVASAVYIPTSVGQNVKIAIGYKTNDFVFYVNGTQIGTASSGAVPALSTVNMGQFGGVLDCIVNTKQALLFPTRLSNSELQSLTTL